MTPLDDAAIEAIARRVVQLLKRDAVAETGARRLVSAAQIARQFDISRQWVYENADRLGAVRLGDGARPRLRFDPTFVERQLSADDDPPPDTTPRRQSRRVDPGELIPLRGL